MHNRVERVGKLTHNMLQLYLENKGNVTEQSIDFMYKDCFLIIQAYFCA